MNDSNKMYHLCKDTFTKTFRGLCYEDGSRCLQDSSINKYFREVKHLLNYNAAAFFKPNWEDAVAYAKTRPQTSSLLNIYHKTAKHYYGEKECAAFFKQKEKELQTGITMKEGEAPVDFEAIKLFYNEYKATNKKTQQIKTLLAFIIHLDPLRCDDYCKMSFENETDTHYVCLENKTIEFKNGKSKSNSKRIVSIPNTLMPILLKHHETFETLLFPNEKTGKQKSADAVGKMLLRTINHSSQNLRSSFVSQNISNWSASEREKHAEIMGHSLITQYKEYAKYNKTLQGKESEINKKEYEAEISQLKNRIQLLETLLKKHEIDVSLI